MPDFPPLLCDPHTPPHIHTRIPPPHPPQCAPVDAGLSGGSIRATGLIARRCWLLGSVFKFLPTHPHPRTAGDAPYKTLKWNAEVAEAISAGQKMPQAKFCPDVMYVLSLTWALISAISHPFLTHFSAMFYIAALQTPCGVLCLAPMPTGGPIGACNSTFSDHYFKRMFLASSRLLLLLTCLGRRRSTPSHVTHQTHPGPTHRVTNPPMPPPRRPHPGALTWPPQVCAAPHVLGHRCQAPAHRAGDRGHHATDRERGPRTAHPTTKQPTNQTTKQTTNQPAKHPSLYSQSIRILAPSVLVTTGQVMC